MLKPGDWARNTCRRETVVIKYVSIWGYSGLTPNGSLVMGQHCEFRAATNKEIQKALGMNMESSYREGTFVVLMGSFWRQPKRRWAEHKTLLRVEQQSPLVVTDGYRSRRVKATAVRDASSKERLQQGRNAHE